MITDFSPLYISLFTATIATIIVFVLGVLAAFLLYRAKGALKYITDVIFSLPLVLPPTVIGFALLVICGKNGAIGKLLAQMDISFIFTPQSAILSAAVVAFPLMYRMALSAFRQVDTNVLNAARTLGFTEGKIFARLLLPLAGHGIFGGVALSFARALGEFGATLMVAGNIPGQTQTMPIAIYFAVSSGNMQAAAIWTGIITAVSALALLLINIFAAQNKKRGAVNEL